MENIDYALICKALGDPHRLEIIVMLSDGEKCACKLLERFNISQPTLSHHMKKLCDCGLVNVHKEGKWSHYSIAQDILKDYVQFINSLTKKQEIQMSCCK